MARDLLEVVDAFNGVEHCDDGEKADRAFFPVTRRDRIICALLASVIVVAVCNIGSSLSALIEIQNAGSQEVEVLEVASGESQADDFQEDENSDTVDYNELALRALESEHDGVIEVPLDEIYREKSVAAEELSYIHEQVLESDGGTREENIREQRDKSERYESKVRTKDGRELLQNAANGEQLGKLQSCSLSNSESDYYGESEYLGRVQAGNDYRAASIYKEMERQKLACTPSLYRDTHGSGVYRYGDREYSVKHRAMWLGGVGVKTWSKFYVKFATSSIGKKIERAGLAPLIAFTVGMGGYSVADTELAAIGAEERVMVSESTAVLANAAIEADASEIAYATSSRIVYNAANGIEMNASEVAQATAQDIITAVETGELPTAANATWETGLASLMAGGMPVEWTQPFAAYGESLLDFFNLENPESAVSLTPYDDAPVLKTVVDTVNSEIPIYSETYGGLPCTRVVRGSVAENGGYSYYAYRQDEDGSYTYGQNQSSQLDGMGWDTWKLAFRRDYNKTKYDAVLFRGNDNGRYVSLDVFQGKTLYIACDYEFIGYYSISDYNDIYRENASYLISNEPVYDERQEEQESGSGGSVFDNGYRAVGNDAQFDDDGNMVSAGTVNVLDPVSRYDSGDSAGGQSDGSVGYGSYSDLLDDSGVSLTKPIKADTVSADDPVYEPGKPDSAEGAESGESSGSGEPKTIGEKVDEAKNSPPSTSKLRTDLAVNMNDLGNAVSQKFPFSVPANVSKTVKSLEAEPEAPHFTWVFELPTGHQELEVSLEDYSPVAHVLRLTLDVMLVFSVIGLLGKIAQVWGFIDKAVD